MDFNVRPVGKLCAASGQELPSGRPCWSVLIERDGQIVRQDYSEDAWGGPPDGVIGYWKSVVPDRTSATSTLLNIDSLFEYFVQLCDSPNRTEQDYQYVLALLLLRKRRLLLEESIVVDDHPTMRLIGTAGEGPFDVPERALTECQIEELQNQLFSVGAG